MIWIKPSSCHRCCIIVAWSQKTWLCSFQTQIGFFKVRLRFVWGLFTRNKDTFTILHRFMISCRKDDAKWFHTNCFVSCCHCFLFLLNTFLIFIKCSCQPTGNISEGERTRDNQSKQAATLQMITIREIVPQFTMSRHNRLQNRHIETIIIARLKTRNANRPLENQTRNLTLHKPDLVLHLPNDSSGLVFPAFQLLYVGAEE